MTTPAFTYFQSATSSFRASATIVVLRRRRPLRFDSFVKPKGERRVRLIAQPQPGELDQCCSQSRISGFGHSLFPIDRSTLPGCRRHARISGDLASVVEMAEKPFRPKYGGE